MRDGKGRFQPGKSGNPEGRARKLPVREALFAVLEEDYGGVQEGLKEAWRVQIRKAIQEGDHDAFKDMNHYAQGKPPSTVIHKTDESELIERFLAAVSGTSVLDGASDDKGEDAA